ncbi:hypothetical protein [Rhizomonospora bruguierae]|uniref:hypothetical protein n=1 Tax=Rhizomonospora bruguierae TaxID=1581705 RepID=UPI001BCD8559|nr:hypothetical protein [Micromonospora sp. NBRC 107566]
MTSPLPPWLARQDVEAIAFEERAAEQLTAAARRELVAVTRRVTAEYVRRAGGVDQLLPADQVPAFRAVLVAALAGLSIRVGDRLARIAAAGLALGLRHAAAVLGNIRLRLRPSPALRDVVAAVNERAAADLAAAVRAARTADLERHSDVMAAVGRANQAVHRVDATTRWVANRAVNEGIAAAADDAVAARLWVAERDACLTCLAYAGMVVGAGELFPAGQTFGDTSAVVGALAGPPAHPRCRCRLSPWLSARESADGVNLPDVLRREAQRTVLRGWSAHASEPARLRAADRVLRSHLLVPRSVADRARRAVAAGTFDT